MDEEHQLLRHSSGLFALDALSPADTRAFARHLLSCAECAAEASALRAAVDLLLCGTPPVEPPTRLRAQVLERCLRS